MISLHERTAEFVATRKPLHGSQEAVIALDTAYALIAELDAALTQCRQKALEEAASLCRTLAYQWNVSREIDTMDAPGGTECAAAIHALAAKGEK